MRWNWDAIRRVVRRTLSPYTRHAASVDPDLLRKMAHGIMTTRSDEIGCEECFEQMDRFADIVLDGRDAAAALPLVHDHLNRCRDCHEEYDTLMVALRAFS